MALRADAAYDATQRPRSEKKDQNDVETCKLWGVPIECVRGRSIVSRHKRCTLSIFTLLVLNKPLAYQEKAALVGNWNSVMICRRPSFSVMQVVFEDLEIAKK